MITGPSVSTEAALSTASDYLKTLLGPDFAEGVETEGPVIIAADKADILACLPESTG
jgi:hypothetical protein